MRWFRADMGLPEPTLPKAVWNGSWLGGSGANVGSRERAFARWCKRKGHLCVRTVELFWFRRQGDLPRFDRRALHKMWRYRLRANRLFLECGVWEVFNRGERKLVGRELREWVNAFHPHPGRWDLFFRRKKEYYAKNRIRFRSANAFWRACPLSARRAFLGCSDRFVKMPEAYPDYFVVFRGQKNAAFVEVKGARESIRPSQRKFFPILVQDAAQQVLLVRIEPGRGRLRWFSADAFGFKPRKEPTG
jgi:hypothetical protein